VARLADVRTQLDADARLVEQMLAPPPLDEARSSLEYWQRRRRALPIYRRAARREATEMAARWQERVHAAEQLLFEASLFGRLLAYLGISGLWARRARLTKRRLLLFGWGLAPRKLKVVAGVVAATWLIVALAVVAAVVVAVQFG
jgi:hypothetical protein